MIDAWNRVLRPNWSRIALLTAQINDDKNERAAAEVRDLAGSLNRLTAALARQTEQADQPQVVLVVSGRVALGAVLAVARDRAVHDPRVLLAHALIAHAQPLEHARAEGLQHDVRLAHQRQQRLAAAVALQVQSDRALVAVQR